MARNNKVTMPTSGAGITRYFEEYKSSISISPGQVIILVILVLVIVILLHRFGRALLGV